MLRFSRIATAFGVVVDDYGASLQRRDNICSGETSTVTTRKIKSERESDDSSDVPFVVAIYTPHL